MSARLDKPNKKCALLTLAFMLISIITACGSAGGNDDVQSADTLIYANLTENGVDRQAVDRFNLTHTDVQIEVRNYFDEDGTSGKDRLFTEIAAGNSPDIIDLGNDSKNSCQLPYQMMVKKGLLENLWPYIESDPDLGRESVVEAPLKAAEVDGGLYAAFGSVHINTLVGAESIVGDRYSWTLDELRDTFSAMPEGSTVLEFFLQKSDLFHYLFRMSIEDYVNWETGQCTFTGEEFRDALEFINSFPDETSNLYSDNEEMNREATKRLQQGLQMLSMVDISRPSDMQILDAYYGQGGHIALIGYPVAEGKVGSSFWISGPRLAMSSTCSNKEAAWEFIRGLLLPDYRDTDGIQKARTVDLPVNRADYELLKQLDVVKGRKGESVSYSYGTMLKYRKTTVEELERFENFVRQIDRIDLYDNEIYDIAQETVTPYFTGDKTLDETVELLQNRVSLYVNEQK